MPVLDTDTLSILQRRIEPEQSPGVPVAYVLVVQNEQTEPVAGFAILRDHYLFPDGTKVIIRADVAWCRNCRGFSLAERLMTADELEREAEEWFYASYPEEQTPYMQPLMKRVLLAQRQGNVERYRRLLDYLPHRQSPPRCLECGGLDFVRFREWNTWYEHPESSGRFRIDCRGHIDHTMQATYSPEGILLSPLSREKEV